MSFRFPSSFAATAFTTFTKIEDFFDPRLNPILLEAINSRDFTVERLLKISPYFFSDENISQLENVKNLFTLARNWTESSKEYQILLDFVRMIPENKRWFLHFFNLSSIRLNANGEFRNVTTTYLDCRSDYSSSSQFAIDNYIRDGNHTSLSGVLSEFNTHYDKLIAVMNNNLRKTFNVMDTRVLDDNITKHALGAMSYQNYVFDPSTQGSLNARQVFDILLSNSNARLEITFLHGTDFRAKLIQPIDITNRSSLYRVMNYSMDVTGILPWPKRLKFEAPQTLLMGVELELITDHTIREIIDAAEEPFFIAKSDGSISGRKSNPMELVTVPGTLKYLKRQYALWFNKLDYNKFDCTTETTNGMHVHLGREFFFDNDHIRRFCWFFHNPANTEFIVALSERGSLAAMQQYTPIYNFSSSYSKTRCYKDIYRIVGSGHRGATNFKNGWERAKTVEVRIFRGIVSYASIVKNLEAVDAIFNFTSGMTSLQEQTLSGFLKWLKNTPSNKYQVLKKFVGTFDLDKIMTAAELRDYIFNETNEEKIVTLMNKAPFAVHNGHISILNQGKKRTFVLNKNTGLVELSQHNKGKMSYLDAVLAKNYLRNTNAA